MKQAEKSTTIVGLEAHQQPPLLPVELKGPATYLSWSRRIMGGLVGRGEQREGVTLKGEESEPDKDDTMKWKMEIDQSKSMLLSLSNSGLITITSPRISTPHSIRDGLLSQDKIPTLDEAIATMIEEETRIQLLSPLYRRLKACLKPPKEREIGGRRQPGGHGRGRGGRRGGRGGQLGGHRANLTVAEEARETSAEEQQMLKMWRKMKYLLRVTTRQQIESAQPLLPWILVLLGMSLALKALHYTPVVVPESIRTADGTAQPVIGNGTVEGV
ncbi:hypothetical protein M569_00114 [Genlisea aurea]|uniref:Retrotransposon Copia-like N-terminal domain-containing protein n=1 Tax=Genlisea aurea TaxID=192259 RepID=S8D5D8_9LAMI|nr:hypothetical protein M569_00114 [Genlisea aurea]